MRWRSRGVGLILAVSTLVGARTAFAEVVLGKTDSGLEFLTEGRLGGFFEALSGQTLPTGSDQNGNLLHGIGDGGLSIPGVNPALPMGSIGQGTIEGSRVRSGFLGNIIAFAVRTKIGNNIRVDGYFSIWADIESENERKFEAIYPDIREGYVRVQGPFGSVLVGRSTTLFSRGATEIDFLYGHRYGVGNPAGFVTQGPSGGQVGYGLLANGFGAGIVYATPSFHGLVLTAGYYDPNRFVGYFWDRTVWGRGESEATFDAPLGNIGKVHLFLNGAYQKIYLLNSNQSTSVWGFGAGGRVELSIFRLGIAAHSGQGLGLNYAFDGSNAILNLNTLQLRKFDGLYAQMQVVLGSFDLGAGAGITRVHEVPGDVVPDPMTGMVDQSVLKDQVGINASIVYHFSEALHFDIDYFRASAQWWLGESQVVNTINSGLILTW
jgi:Gram-negative porin